MNKHNNYYGGVETDVECPFCGCYLEVMPPFPSPLFCGNCDLKWENLAEVKADYVEIRKHDDWIAQMSGEDE